MVALFLRDSGAKTPCKWCSQSGIYTDCNDEQIRALLPVVQVALKIVKSQSLTAAE